MAYSTGMMNKRVTVAKRAEAQDNTFGGTSSVTRYELFGTFWMSETFNKGVKSLREGALDAYDTVMFRMRWNNIVTRESLLECEGVKYQIQSLHADRMENIVQITATEMTTK